MNDDVTYALLVLLWRTYTRFLKYGNNIYKSFSLPYVEIITKSNNLTIIITMKCSVTILHKLSFTKGCCVQSWNPICFHPQKEQLATIRSSKDVHILHDRVKLKTFKRTKRTKTIQNMNLYFFCLWHMVKFQHLSCPLLCFNTTGYWEWRSRSKYCVYFCVFSLLLESWDFIFLNTAKGHM